VYNGVYRKMIKTFNSLDQAFEFITIELAYSETEYFKVEILSTTDGRIRVGIITEPQLDLFDGLVD
jgi:hypothetical protein